MATFTDDFNRANGALGASWQSYTQAFTVSSNAALYNATFTGASFVVAAQSSGDMYAQATVGAVVSGAFHGLIVRAPSTIGTTAAGTGAFYVGFIAGTSSDSWSIRRKEANASTLTTLGTTLNGTVLQVGDVVKLEAVQSGADVILNLYRNGTLHMTRTDTGASVIPETQRNAGMTGTTAAGVTWDNFSSGENSGGTPPGLTVASATSTGEVTGGTATEVLSDTDDATIVRLTPGQVIDATLKAIEKPAADFVVTAKAYAEVGGTLTATLVHGGSTLATVSGITPGGSLADTTITFPAASIDTEVTEAQWRSGALHLVLTAN